MESIQKAFSVRIEDPLDNTEHAGITTQTELNKIIK